MTDSISPAGNDTCNCAVSSPSHATDRMVAGGLSRRRFLHAALASSASGVLTGSVATPRIAAAQGSLTPDSAVQSLMDGNRRYVEGGLRSLDEDLKLLKEKTAEKQEPFAAVLSCADSRVPVEFIFDQTIGAIFVTRVAGNIASGDIIASLEYGAEVLGTKAIMVLGHGNCGAVKATIAGKPVPGQISSLYRYIRPAVDRAGHDLDAAIKANAEIQAGLLREASPVLAGLVKQGKLKVVAAFYDLANGMVTQLS